MKYVKWASPNHHIDGKWSKRHIEHPDGNRTLCGRSYRNMPSYHQPFEVPGLAFDQLCLVCQKSHRRMTNDLN